MTDRDAIHEIIREADRLVWLGHDSGEDWSELAARLRSIDVVTAPTIELLSWLRATCCLAARVSAWRDFRDAATVEMQRRGCDTKKMLRGLTPDRDADEAPYQAFLLLGTVTRPNRPMEA